jgi:co-chaperonin GroES (HSP10)
VADPKHAVLGNKSDEQGAFEEGADFGALNHSEIPANGEHVDVEVAHDGKNLHLTPTKFKPQKTHAPIELHDGPRQMIDATIFEDPSMISRVTGDITRKSSRGALIFFAVSKHSSIAVWGDRVLIKRDSMESAYSCQTCRGKGHSETQCPTCKGSAIDIDGKSPCRSCQVLGYGMEAKRAAGRTICEACSGSGWAGGIVRPEITQSEPITGIVVSVGPQCVNLQLGDRVLHSRYSGHQQSAPSGEFYTVMAEHEVLELVREIGA